MTIHSSSAKFRVILTTGLALFAMFFGAGSIVLPLNIGVHSGQYIIYALLAFLITGVGVPFLGLFAMSLFGGDYWKFFGSLGKIPAFFIITFLLFIIGPLFAAPRTEIVTYHTLLPFLPDFLKNMYVFDFLYFAIIFAIVYKQSQIVDLIGKILSPIKIFMLMSLILVGLFTAQALLKTPAPMTHVINAAISGGYGTMDLLGAFFYCAVAYNNIVSKCKKLGVTSEKEIIKITIQSCLIGALIISLIYTGLILAAFSHAGVLQNVPTESLIVQISFVVLGKAGSFFVCACVFFACLATGTALTEVSSEYFYHTVFQKKVPRTLCLIIVLAMMFSMAILGFSEVMRLALPILNYLYPALIVFCIFNVVRKLKPSLGYLAWLKWNKDKKADLTT